MNATDRSYYGIPDDMLTCRCRQRGCMYFSTGYPFCGGCREHHRTPVVSTGQPCPIDGMMKRPRDPR